MDNDPNDRNDNSPESEDETLYADSVGSPRTSIDQLAVRTVDAVLGLLRRANRLATGVLVVSGGMCVLGYVLGLAALDGGARTAWMILGGVSALAAIGTVVLAMWRLSVVARSSISLTEEVRSLIGGDPRSERAVIETVQVTEESGDVGVVQVSRQFFSLRSLVDGGSRLYPTLSMALGAITGFPLSMLLAVFIGLGFLTVSLIFILMLIF